MTRSNILEVRKIPSGEFIWHFKSSNGKIVSNGETFKTKAGAHKGACVGSPVAEIDEDNHTISYYSSGELVEGKYVYVDETKLIEDQPLETPAGLVSLEDIKANTDILNLIGAGFKKLEDGHFVLNNHVYHPKHPDLNQCAIPFCQMYMHVQGNITG